MRTTRCILHTPFAVTILQYLIQFPICHLEQTFFLWILALSSNPPPVTHVPMFIFDAFWWIFLSFFLFLLSLVRGVHSLKLKCTMTNKFHFFITFKTCFAQNLKKIVWRCMSYGRKVFLCPKPGKCIILRNFYKYSHYCKFVES